MVIYIGKNTDGIACGSPQLFDYFRWREVLVYDPDPQNVLIVYGALREEPRMAVHHEEAAGMYQQSIWRYSGTREQFPVR